MSGLDEQPGVGIPGVTGGPRAQTWDAVASAHAPALTGDSITFVALEDGTLLVDEDVLDGALAPMADALEERIPPPYRASAVRDDGDVWSVSAQSVSVVQIGNVEGDVIDLTVVGGTRELSIDGESASRVIPELDALMEEGGDTVVRAERLDGDLFTVDVFAL